MNTTEMNIKSQKVIDFKLNYIKFNVRKHYRRATQSERLSSVWMERLSDKVNQEIKDIISLTDGNYSMLNIAVAAMNSKKINAKK